MDNFTDSGMFKMGPDGRVCHRRDGDTWADKVLDGVDLDKTMYWENCGYTYVEEEEGDEMVGDRKVSNEVQETTKVWGKERGEGKFKREKKIPQKRGSKYPTKPKPKNSWHKRISKVARQLDMEDIGSHTEQVADEEWNDFWDEKRLEAERVEEAYWDSWTQDVKDFPGHYAVISVKILVDRDGVSVHDIDAAGVNRGNRYDPYNSRDIRHMVMDEWSKLPSAVNGPVCGTDTFVIPGFSFHRYDFFTYWDEENGMYIWKDMSKHSWCCGGWRDHFDYYPDMNKLEKIFCLDKQYLPWKEVGTLSRWINGIEWNTVWSRMDEIRTGTMYGREHEYVGGDGFENRSRETVSYASNHPYYQIPRMVFH
jgi:hypothetical protein